jgi:hypothetical protein
VVGTVRATPDPDGLCTAIDPATCAVADLVDELRFAAFWCVEAEGRAPVGLPGGLRAAQVRAVLEAAAGRLAQAADGADPVRPPPPATGAEQSAVVHAAHRAAGERVAEAQAAARRLHADARGAVHDVLEALAEVQQAEHTLVSALDRLAP